MVLKSKGLLHMRSKLAVDDSVSVTAAHIHPKGTTDAIESAANVARERTSRAVGNTLLCQIFAPLGFNSQRYDASASLLVGTHLTPEQSY